jgi:hypothetical protein
VREQAIAVRESRRRLLSVGDAERQALETRLQAGPVGRLQRAIRVRIAFPQGNSVHALMI